MREVSVERFVRATSTEVERALSPAAAVEYEGTLDVLDSETRGGETFVTAGASGVGVTLRFESGADGLRYEQVGDAGPFEEMWTALSWEPDDEGTRVTARSGVALGLPFGLTDRIAAWKRRGELERALDNLAADVE